MQTLLLMLILMFLKVQGIVMMLLMEFLMVLMMLVLTILKSQWILNPLHGMRKKRSAMRK